MSFYPRKFYSIATASGFPQTAISALLPKADMCGAKEHVRFGPIADILVSGMSARGRRELSQVGLHALKPCADPCLELCVYYWAVLWGGLKVDGPDDNTKTVEGFENLDGSPV